MHVFVREQTWIGPLALWQKWSTSPCDAAVVIAWRHLERAMTCQPISFALLTPFVNVVEHRSQTHFSPHAPPLIHPPAPAPASTKEGARHGPAAQEEAEEKKDLAAPVRRHAHHPRGRRRGVRRRRTGSGRHAHGAARYPTTGKIGLRNHRGALGVQGDEIHSYTLRCPRQVGTLLPSH